MPRKLDSDEAADEATEAEAEVVEEGPAPQPGEGDWFATHNYPPPE